MITREGGRGLVDRGGRASGGAGGGLRGRGGRVDGGAGGALGGGRRGLRGRGGAAGGRRGLRAGGGRRHAHRRVERRRVRAAGVAVVDPAEVRHQGAAQLRMDPPVVGDLVGDGTGPVGCDEEVHRHRQAGEGGVPHHAVDRLGDGDRRRVVRGRRGHRRVRGELRDALAVAGTGPAGGAGDDVEQTDEEARRLDGGSRSGRGAGGSGREGSHESHEADGCKQQKPRLPLVVGSDGFLHECPFSTRCEFGSCMLPVSITTFTTLHHSSRNFLGSANTKLDL